MHIRSFISSHAFVQEPVSETRFGDIKCLDPESWQWSDVQVCKVHNIAGEKVASESKPFVMLTTHHSLP